MRKKLKSRGSLGELWNNVKCNRICILGVTKGKESKQEIENMFEKMAEHFPNLVKEKVTQVQETQSPNQDEPQKTHTEHIIIKMVNIKDKERIF